MRHRDLVRLIAPAVLLAGLTRAAEIQGVVRAKSGEPIPYASVTIPVLSRGALTDSAGAFALADLPPGRHAIVAGAIGHTSDTARVDLADRAVRRLDFALAPAPVVVAPVTVRADRPSEAAQSTAFVAALRPDEIAAPAATIPEILDGTVGVRVRSMGGYGSYSAVSIRGSTAEQVRIYLDGIPLNQAVGGGVNLSAIPLSTIERVEVYRGVIPPEFGGSGLSGVVNLRTRPASDSTRWQAGVSYGSWDTRVAHAWASRGFGIAAALIALDYSSADNDYRYRDDNGTTFNPSDDTWARRRNNEFASASVLARVSAPADAPIRWTTSWEFLRTTNHLPGNSTFHDIPSTAAARADQHLVEVDVFAPLPLVSELRVQAYGSERRDRFADSEGLIGLGVKDTDDRSRIAGARIGFATFALPAQRFAIDASAQRERFSPDDNAVTDPADRDRYLRPSRRAQVAMHFSDEASFLDRRLTLTAQAGWQRVENDGSREVVYGSIVDHDSTVTTAWPHAIGISVRPRPWVTVQANWGRYLRVPNLYELYGDRGSAIGNANLRPERGTNLDAGVRVEGTRPRLGVLRAWGEFVAFDNRITDAILFWEAYNRMKPFNMGGARIRGIEVSGAVETRTGLVLAGNVTVQEPRNETALYAGDDLPHRPRLQGDLTPSYTRGPITLSYGLHVHSAYYGQPNNRFADTISAAWVHDAGVRYAAGRALTIAIEGRNLGDVREFTSRYVPLPGRSYFVSIRVASP